MSKPKSESLGRSSGKISLATAGSRVTGLLRETVFAYLLGGSQAADAYFAATRIPNLLRDLFAEGALGSAFVPVLTETLALGQTDKARQLVRGMAGGLASAAGLAVSWALAHGVGHPPGRVLTLMCVWGVFLLTYFAPVFIPGSAARKVTRQLVHRAPD